MVGSVAFFIGCILLSFSLLYWVSLKVDNWLATRQMRQIREFPSGTAKAVVLPLYSEYLIPDDISWLKDRGWIVPRGLSQVISTGSIKPPPTTRPSEVVLASTISLPVEDRWMPLDQIAQVRWPNDLEKENKIIKADLKNLARLLDTSSYWTLD